MSTIFAAAIDLRESMHHSVSTSRLSMGMTRLMVLALTYPIGNAIIQTTVRGFILGSLLLTQEIPHPLM
ncbi:MAG: hypothetical protein QG629_360 [Patescibacteria group bacterium]|nr:hypothetical protein [Candidatus Saccharibacteria bacterium]MDQ5963278.1 hypothetical protein [Patescibacteria group bacterium]